MAMKGVLREDHIPSNKFTLSVPLVAGGQFTPISVTGFDRKVGVVDLPDRTKATDGVSKAINFEMTLPAHHSDEIAAMELWFRESQDPVSPLYKKPGVFTQESLTGRIVRKWELIGLWTSGPKNDDSKLADEGTMVTITYQMHCDDAVYVP